MNSNSTKNIIILVLILICVYLILVKYSNFNETNSVEKMVNILGGNLDSEYSSGRLYNKVRNTISNKLRNLKIVEENNRQLGNKNNNLFKLSKDTIPVGQISYFVKEIPEDTWLLCDGRELEGIKYLELFRLFKRREPLFEEKHLDYLI